MIDMKKRLSIYVTQLVAEKPTHFSGANRLYSSNKGINKPNDVISDRKNANVKFRISKYLTAIMLALPIARGMRTKYFNRLCVLLIEKYQSFSVRHTTWYFGFRLPCNICSQMCAITMSKNRKVCWKCKKQVIQQPPKVPIENAIFKDPMYKEEKKIYLPRRGISFIKQLAYKIKKPYQRYEGNTPIQYKVIYSRYREEDLELGTRKAEILMKRRGRGLANNKYKWRILENGDVLSTPLSHLSYHIFKTREAILKEVYIRSSNLAQLYSNVNSRQRFNELNNEIILNHTYDEDDFAMIKSFKEEQLPAVRTATNEDYRRVRTFIYEKFDMSRIDPWFIKRRNELTETKSAKRRWKYEKKRGYVTRNSMVLPSSYSIEIEPLAFVP
ncbi:unnamed protein product [Rhizophagus irregularis]|nr:unnamed protein product [Rhizophagus irregularis]